MEKTEFKKLITMLDKEIESYEVLKSLFEEKRDVLKKAKSSDLVEVDNRIIAQSNSITKINKTRQELSYNYTGKDCSMSDFIEIIGSENEQYKTELEERKVKICNILDELTLLNNQNVELLKHGIVMTDKMLETIVDAFAPQGSNYNGAGKTDTHDLNMWTVNEEI